MSQQPSLDGLFEPQLPRALFFALRPDAEATLQTMGLMVHLHTHGIMQGVPLEASRLHVTLCDLGNFRDQMPPSLIPKARAAAATLNVAPFPVVFDRMVGGKGPFFLRASESAALQAFRRGLDAALIKAGLRRHVNSKFAPHMTLAYGSGNVPEEPIAPISWVVKEFVLIESLVGLHRHIERGRWPLRGAFPVEPTGSPD